MTATASTPAREGLTATEGAKGAEWGYRPYLDGLRAVAVYLVVLFHADVDVFEGGFIGVDLFFVLSGFLVTNVLVDDLQRNGTVRLRRFYARRARRLIPAASVTIVGTCLIALAISSSLDRASMVGDARAASLWYANWHFISEANDYFAATGAESPFLHFWSLAIEEQFYLVFPLVVLAAWRLGRGRVTTLVAVVAASAVVSLAIQFIWASRDVNRAYLGTDARVYQILAGALLGLALRGRARDRHRRWAAIGAMSLLVLFVVASTPVLAVGESWRGVAACSVAVALILSLEFDPNGVSARLLAVRPLVYLGRISYGTYLWHWPILVLFERVLEFGPAVAVVLSGVGGTALAALSQELVERPIRSSVRLNAHHAVVIASGIATALLVGVVVAPAVLGSDQRPAVTVNGAVTLDEGSVRVVDEDWDAIRSDEPQLPLCERRDGGDCFVGEPGDDVLLLAGDSHARMLIPTLQPIAAAHGLALAIVYAPSCPWQRDLLTGEPGSPRTQRCEETRRRMFDEVIPALDPAVMAVAGFPRSLGLGADVFSPDPSLDELDDPALVASTTEMTLREWAAEGRVVLAVEPIPVFPRNQDQLSCLSGAEFYDECVFRSELVGAEEVAIRSTALQEDNVVALDLDDAVCPRAPLCDPVVDELVVRRDSNHVTGAFAAHLSERVAGLLPDPLEVDAG